uniref:Uncharacterized protein n=1 Tax=Leersia perrieri TaxID=77586 RepID=A0A0D9W4M6_9ORYZ
MAYKLEIINLFIRRDKIELRCIRINLTTVAYIDGYTQKIGDQREFFNLRRSFEYLEPLMEDLFATRTLVFFI